MEVSHFFRRYFTPKVWENDSHFDLHIFCLFHGLLLFRLAARKTITYLPSRNPKKLHIELVVHESISPFPGTSPISLFAVAEPLRRKAHILQFEEHLKVYQYYFNNYRHDWLPCVFSRQTYNLSYGNKRIQEIFACSGHLTLHPFARSYHGSESCQLCHLEFWCDGIVFRGKTWLLRVKFVSIFWDSFLAWFFCTKFPIVF